MSNKSVSFTIKSFREEQDLKTRAHIAYAMLTDDKESLSKKEVERLIQKLAFPYTHYRLTTQFMFLWSVSPQEKQFRVELAANIALAAGFTERAIEIYEKRGYFAKAASIAEEAHLLNIATKNYLKAGNQSKAYEIMGLNSKLYLREK